MSPETAERIALRIVEEIIRSEIEGGTSGLDLVAGLAGALIGMGATAPDPKPPQLAALLKSAEAFLVAFGHVAGAIRAREN